MTNRPATMFATVTAVAVLTSTMNSKPAPLFVWNASESVPIGLYGVQAPNNLIVTSLAVAVPTRAARHLRFGGRLPAARRSPKHAHVRAAGQTLSRRSHHDVDEIDIGAAAE